jgi:hypothetical protein
MTTPEQLAAIREILVGAYSEVDLFGESNPAWLAPDGIGRGEDVHLAFLTLVYTISGGREPVSLWEAARNTYTADPSLFDPQRLAYIKPTELRDPLRQYGLSRKAASEATVWQRIGQALVMRAGGSVKKLLADNGHDVQTLLSMLGRSKTTFPVLSGKQTAPRWLYGLATEGQQPLVGTRKLAVPVSPAASLALEGLEIKVESVSAAVFGPLDALGRLGCRQRPSGSGQCPVASQCPVAQFCQFGRLLG